MKKKVLSLIWTIAILMAFVPTCLAYDLEFDPQQPNNSDLTTSIETVLGIVQWIGFIVAIAMLIYVGIKYLTSGAGKKAEAKDNLIPMLIGAALVALAPTIALAVFSTLKPTP